jgi:ketosteroid isomerase-like protein
MSETKYAAYEALGPFFEIIMKGLSGVVDGDHYFDTIAENATFEFLYEFPGWPRAIRGRAELMTAYSGYGNSIRLRSADKLVVHYAGNGRVVIIEYEVHGKVLGTGAPYDNRFVSIITVLVDERADGVHLSYDRMASLLAPYGNSDALNVARDLDAKVEDLLRHAAA